MSNSHEIYMRRCIELAKKGIGLVSPNPMVGSVIVRDDMVLAEGFHERHGGAHAEANALASTKADLTGATLYCNLEPCSHRGEGKINPPCAEAIIASPIKHVVIGSLDPNPRVAGRGIAAMEAAGIRVEHGILKDECDELNRAFFTHITKKRPFLMLKVAQSLDGFTATRSGDSKWITDETMRAEVHALRGEYDGILTTAKTVLVDNPELTVRHVSGRNPHRLILDRHAELSSSAAVFNTAAPTTVFTAVASQIESAVQIAESGDVAFFRAVINYAYETLGLRSIMIECGGRFAGFLLKERLIDELVVMTAPKILGDGRSTFQGIAADTIADAVTLTSGAATPLGSGIVWKGKLACSLD